ncbi:CAP-Gly domain-containing linker protein 3-like [Orbicella faveolata]|uniref:CAP-Gly domain-containing linker protein 3-like n=1 Tax=Orbicella faveolata TaxID=48498 RepID=UPI0009E302C8|nr:CAP-Gly domain-containing linker protein 3-like [Orbicella faveolata]
MSAFGLSLDGYNTDGSDVSSTPDLDLPHDISVLRDSPTPFLCITDDNDVTHSPDSPGTPIHFLSDFEMEVEINDDTEARQRFESSLPENWVLCSSKSHTGRLYYFNSVTGESRWQHPLLPDMDSPEKTSNSTSGFVVTDFIMPARDKPVSHSPSDPPLCENCRKLELTFFDPNCPGCQDILLDPKTTISEIFAIMRQWVPQVQQNIEMLVKEVLRRGAHVDDRDGLTDMTLLHYACKAGAVGVGDVAAASIVVSSLISQNEIPATLASMGLKIGDQVCIGGNKFGTLRFCGPTDFASGEWAGMELDTPIGKNDGSVGGVVYFQCPPKHGIFAPLSKITKADSIQKQQTPSNSRIAQAQVSQSSSRASSRSNSRPNSRPSSRSNSPAPSSRVNGTDESLGFQIGDNVMVAGQKNGVVRFIGRTQFASGMWLGIELDQPVGKNDGSVAGVRYFDCKPSHGVFAPPSKVTKGADHSNTADHNGFAVPSIPVLKGKFGSQNSLQASGSHGSLSDLSQTDSNPDLSSSTRKLSNQSITDQQTPRRGSAASAVSDKYELSFWGIT